MMRLRFPSTGKSSKARGLSTFGFKPIAITSPIVSPPVVTIERAIHIVHVIDDDEEEEVPAAVVLPGAVTVVGCQAYSPPFPGHFDIWYPFAQHLVENIAPFNFYVDKGCLRHVNCPGLPGMGSTQCIPCKSLGDSTIIKDTGTTITDTVLDEQLRVLSRSYDERDAEGVVTKQHSLTRVFRRLMVEKAWFNNSKLP